MCSKLHWRIAMGITLIRVLLLVPFFLFLLASTREDGTFFGIVVVLLIMLLDLIDGRYAEARGVNSPSRRLADNLADKVISHALMLGTVVHYHLPFWMYGAMLIRDAILGFGSLSLFRDYCVVFYPNVLHKISVFFLGLAGCILLSGQWWYYAIIPLITGYVLYYLSLIDQLGSFFAMPYSKRQGPCRKLLEYHPKLFAGFNAILGGVRKPTVARHDTKSW